MEKTLTIIKPNALINKTYTEIIDIINKKNFNILEMKMLRLTNEQVSSFYQEHKEKSFFNNLVEFMTSGKIIVAVLEKENAIKDLRNLMGETNPKNAKEGTIRKLYGESLEKNSIHGSDSRESAKREINFFLNII